MGTGRSIITSVSSGCNHLPTYCQTSVSRTSRRQRSSLWGWSIRMRLDTKWQKCLKPFSGKFCLTSVRKFWREKSWDSVTLLEPLTPIKLNVTQHTFPPTVPGAVHSFKILLFVEKWPLLLGFSVTILLRRCHEWYVSLVEACWVSGAPRRTFPSASLLSALSNPRVMGVMPYSPEKAELKAQDHEGLLAAQPLLSAYLFQLLNEIQFEAININALR